MTLTDKKSDRNPYVECVKCRNLWVAIAILVAVSVVIFGFVFFGFADYIKPNMLHVVDLLRYGALLFVIGLCSYASIRLFRTYCTDKNGYDGTYKRESEILFGACITSIVVIMAIAVMGMMLPSTLEEYQFRETFADEGWEVAIGNLTCQTFKLSSEDWNRWQIVDFAMYDWSEGKGLYKNKLSYNKYRPDESREFLADKFKECWT